MTLNQLKNYILQLESEGLDLDLPLCLNMENYHIYDKPIKENIIFELQENNIIMNID